MFFLAASAAFADVRPSGVTGTLAGLVTDAETEEPLIGVNIVFLDTKYGGVTNEEGKYRIFNIPVGRYTVQYSYIGYKKHTVENVRINADEKTVMNIGLEAGELELEEVVVTAEPLMLKRDITGTAHIVEARQIELMPVDNFMEMIKIQPGVTRDLHIRGGRQSEVMYLVDGLPYTEAAGGAVGGMLPKSAVLEMKILTGGFDAEYGNAMSGVINIVTKRGSTDKTAVVRAETDSYFNLQESNNERLFELTLGGPVSSNNINYFTATDFRMGDTRWRQDFDRFFDGPILKEFNNVTKFDYNMTGNFRVNVQALTSYLTTRDYEFRWRLNLTGLPERRKFSNRTAVGVSYTLNENTFFNLSLTQYYLHTRLGPENRDSLDPNDLWDYDFRLQFVTGGSRLWWADEKQTQYTIKGDITSQVEKQSTVKAGFEFTFYDMNIQRVKFEPQTSFYGWPLLYLDPLDYSTSYRYRPRTGSVYIQDKILLLDEGTFNLGMRWDFLDPRAERPNLEWVPTGDDDFEKEISEWVPASVKHQFSPRFGFALPIGGRQLFLVNMGFFFQMPLFDYLYSGLDINLKKKNSVLVGNPDMKPMVTKAREVSYRRKLGESFDFTMTWFDKETENLIDTKTFLASDSKALDDGYFAQYVNSPYANSTGLEFTIERSSPGALYGRLSYTYMKSEGVSETRNQELRYIQWGFEPVNHLYPLSWDQRHTVNGVVSTMFENGFSCDVILNYHSPRPYTYYPSKYSYVEPGTVIRPNNKRMKHNLYIDLKARKQFSIGWLGMDSWKWSMYVDVRNLFDRKD